jgi:Transposase
MQESNLSPVITTKRRHSAAFKRKILELVEQPGVSVAAVALEHGVNANLVFSGRLGPRGFLPRGLYDAQPCESSGWGRHAAAVGHPTNDADTA